MIKNYKQFESLLNKLQGPSKQDVWDSIGKDFFGLDTPPATVDEFLDYLFEISEANTESVIDYNMYRVRFKNRALFFIVTHAKILYIYDKLYTVLDLFYNIQSDEQIYGLVKDKLYKLFGDFGIESYNINLLDD